MSARTLIMTVVAGTVVLGAVATLTFVRADETGRPAPDTTAARRVEIATEAVREIGQLLRDGKEGSTYQIFLWEERLYESKLAATTSKREKIEIIEKRLASLKSAEKAVSFLVCN